MNRLDHVGNDNLDNKYKFNDVIVYEPKFNSEFSLPSNPSMDPLPLLSVRLGGGKKNKATINLGLTFLWYSGATNSTVKSKHTGPSEHIFLPNRVYYNTSAGPY